MFNRGKPPSLGVLSARKPDDTEMSQSIHSMLQLRNRELACGAHVKSEDAESKCVPTH